MRTRGLGKTALRVSEMALGTWGLSGDGYGPVDEAQQKRVLLRALEVGITLVDTADAYGAGRMERVIGKTIAGRDDVVVVTKGGTERSTLPPKKRVDPLYLHQACERSLERLVRGRIYVYVLH